MEKKHTLNYLQAIFIQNELKKFAKRIGFKKKFSVELSVSGDYFRLVDENRSPLVADSANEDLYKVETALAYFENYLYDSIN